MSSQKRLYDIANELNDVVMPALDFMSAMERKLYMNELDKKLRITETLKELTECVYKIKSAVPYSEHARTAIGEAYEVVKRVKPIFEELGSYKEWKDRFWSSNIDKIFGEYVNELLRKTEKPLEAAIKDVGYEREVMDSLYKAGKLSKEPPVKRKGGPWDVAAMIIVLALGFAALNWLGDLGTVLPGGELPSISTGFYLLPGGPFVSSMQMVLFLLASAVVVVYLFGKSAGEW